MSTDDKKPIGRILLKRRLISQEELDRQLETQRNGARWASRWRRKLQSSGVVPRDRGAPGALRSSSGVPRHRSQPASRLVSLQHLRTWLPREGRRVEPGPAGAGPRRPPVPRDGEFRQDKRVIDELEFRDRPGGSIPTVAITTRPREDDPRRLRREGAGRDHVRRCDPRRRKRQSAPRPASSPIAVSARASSRARRRSSSTGRWRRPPARGRPLDVRVSGQMGDEVSRVEMLSDELQKLRPASRRPCRPARPTGKRNPSSSTTRKTFASSFRRLLTDRGPPHHRSRSRPDRSSPGKGGDARSHPARRDGCRRSTASTSRRANQGEREVRLDPNLDDERGPTAGGAIAEDLKTKLRHRGLHREAVQDRRPRPEGRAPPPEGPHDNLRRRRGRLPTRRSTTARRSNLEDGIAAYKAGDVDGAINLLKQGIGIDPLAYRLRYHPRA